MQTAMTKYEQKVLNDMRDLSERDQAKLSRIIRFIKQDIIRPEADEKQMTEEFLSVCGTWEDDRSVEQQLQDIYLSRKSTNRTELNISDSNAFCGLGVGNVGSGL